MALFISIVGNLEFSETGQGDPYANTFDSCGTDE